MIGLPELIDVDQPKKTNLQLVLRDTDTKSTVESATDDLQKAIALSLESSQQGPKSGDDDIQKAIENSLSSSQKTVVETDPNLKMRKPSL